jgi:cysteine-rich repeat protein
MFEMDGPLREALTVLRLELYRDPPGDPCDLEAMIAGGRWDPVDEPPFDTVDMSWGEPLAFDLVPGRWAFVFRGGHPPEFEPGERDLARGCVVADLESGHNPTLTIEVHRIEHPAVCGDGWTADSEMCDDGNTDGGDGCSADCMSTEVLRVNESVQSDQYDPAVAGGPEGFMVAWTTNPFEGSEPSAHVRGRLLSVEGRPTTLGPWREVQLNVSSLSARQERPAVAMTSGAVVGVWVDGSPAATVDGDIAWRGLDLGEGTGPGEAILNVETTGSQDEPAAAGHAAGSSVFTAWSTDSSSLGCRLVTDGTPVGDAEHGCAAEPGRHSEPAVAMDAGGHHAVSWTGDDGSGRTVMVRFFSPEGEPVTGELNAVTRSDGEQVHPAVAFDASGRLLVVWKHLPESGDPSVRGRLYSSSGSAAGDDFTISETTVAAEESCSGPAVAGDEGDSGEGVFLVVWLSRDAGIVGRLVSGVDAFAVNRVNVDVVGEPFEDTGQFVVRAAQPDMSSPVVAVSEPGRSLVVWADSSGGGDTDVWGRVIPTW